MGEKLFSDWKIRIGVTVAYIYMYIGITFKLKSNKDGIQNKVNTFCIDILKE